MATTTTKRIAKAVTTDTKGKATKGKAAPASKPATKGKANGKATKGKGSAVSYAEAYGKLPEAERVKLTAAMSAASGETQRCEGACGLVLPINKFPTTGLKKDQTMGRGKECRADRDARYAAAKEAKVVKAGKPAAKGKAAKPAASKPAASRAAKAAAAPAKPATVAARKASTHKAVTAPVRRGRKAA